jgi:hypothetical protein
MESFIIRNFTKQYQCDKLKEDEMARASSTCRWDEKYTHISGWKTRMKEVSLKK